MIRFLLRFLGLWILAGAFIALVYDGTKSIAGNALYITKLSDTWLHLSSLEWLHLSSPETFRPAVVRYAGEWLWDPFIQTVLEQPTWLVLGVLGAILVLLGRKKKPLIGYGRD